MKDVAGNKIAGYRFGPYWFGIDNAGGHGERIHGLSGGSWGSEVELLSAYDQGLGDYADNPKLIRVYAEGAEFQLRPKPREAEK